MKVEPKRVTLLLAAAVLSVMGTAPARAQNTAVAKPAASTAGAKPAGAKPAGAKPAAMTPEEARAAAAQGKVVNSEDVFPGIKVLRGMPLDEFMDTMGFFASSLSMTCTDCHSAESGGDWNHYIDETPRMGTARKM